MTIRHDNYTPKDPSSTGRIFFRDYEDERTDASAGIGVSYPSGIVSVGLSGNEQNVVDGVSSIIPPVVGTASNPSLKLFTPDDIIAFVAAHETGGGGGGNTWSDPVSSNILPSLANDVAFTLGDSDQRFKEIWVSGIHTFSSIDLRGQVFENVGPTSSTLSGVSTAERTAGTETDFRLFSPADISSMALQHGPAAGGITEGELEDLIAGLDASSIQSNDEFLFRVSSGTDELAVTTASGIVDKGLTDLGIDPQNRIALTRNPNANDDGAGTNGVVHIINDLWTNTDTDEAYICLDITTSAAVWSSITAAGGGGVTDHSALNGLGADDHTQYLLTDGTRALTGNQDFGGNVADNYGAASSTLSAVSTDEITAGTSTEYRVYSPADVSAMIAQHQVVPELYVAVTDENNVAGYTNPTQSYPQRFGTNKDWCGFKVNLTEYDEFQVRATYESGDNSGIVLGVGCTSGSTPLNKTNPPFAIGDGQGEAYEYIHSGQLGADAVVSGGVSFDGAVQHDYREGSWTPLDPSVKRECGIAFLYLDGSGVTVGNRQWSRFHVAFRRNR